MNTLQSQQPIPVPAIDQLQQQGWSIAQMNGCYCVAWRGNEEITVSWENQSWRVVSAKRSRPLG